jgi:hypothetical protein
MQIGILQSFVDVLLCGLVVKFVETAICCVGSLEDIWPKLA